jgi:hypothetical protein
VVRELDGVTLIWVHWAEFTVVNQDQEETYLGRTSSRRHPNLSTLVMNCSHFIYRYLLTLVEVVLLGLTGGLSLVVHFDVS